MDNTMTTNTTTSATSNEEGFTTKRQKTDENSNTIVIKFTNNVDNSSFYCVVKPTVKFRKIFETYCQHQNFKVDEVRFIYQDHKILPNLTPLEVSFPDGGEIDVMSSMNGGGKS